MYLKEKTKAYLAIIIQSIIIGLSFYFVKVSLESGDTFSVLAHRFSFAGLGMIIFYFFNRERFNLSFSDWKKILPYAIPYPILFFTLQTIGLNFISSSEAGIISAMTPIFTIIIAGIFINEKISNKQKVFMGISVAGMIFINIMGGFNLGEKSYIGFLFAISSVLAFAFYNVLIKNILKDYDVVEIVFVMNIFAGIIFNIISIILHIRKGSLSTYFKPFQNLDFLIAILYLGIPSSMITSFLSTYALNHLKSSTVGLFNNIPPIISIIAGVVLLNEGFYWFHFIGIVAILIGTIGYNVVE